MLLKGRPGWEEENVVIESYTGNVILLEGKMYNGKLKKSLDAKLVNHPAWRSRY